MLAQARANARGLETSGGDGCSRRARGRRFSDEVRHQIFHAGVQGLGQGDDGVEVGRFQSSLHLSDERVAHPGHGAELFLGDSALRADAAPSRSEISATDGISTSFSLIFTIVSHT
jgi:hypothetical protein